MTNIIQPIPTKRQPVLSIEACLPQYRKIMQAACATKPYPQSQACVCYILRKHCEELTPLGKGEEVVKAIVTELLQNLGKPMRTAYLAELRQANYEFDMVQADYSNERELPMGTSAEDLSNFEKLKVAKQIPLDQLSGEAKNIMDAEERRKYEAISTKAAIKIPNMEALHRKLFKAPEDCVKNVFTVIVRTHYDYFSSRTGSERKEALQDLELEHRYFQITKDVLAVMRFELAMGVSYNYPTI